MRKGLVPQPLSGDLPHPLGCSFGFFSQHKLCKRKTALEWGGDETSLVERTGLMQLTPIPRAVRMAPERLNIHQVSEANGLS